MNVEQVETVVRKWLEWAENLVVCPEMKVASFAYGVPFIPESERIHECTCGWIGAHKNFDSHTTPNPNRAWMRDVVLGREASEGKNYPDTVFNHDVCDSMLGCALAKTRAHFPSSDLPIEDCGGTGRIGAVAGLPGLLVVAESHDGFTLHHVACHGGCTPHKMDSRFSDCDGTGYVLNERFAWLVEHVPAAAAAWIEQVLPDEVKPPKDERFIYLLGSYSWGCSLRLPDASWVEGTGPDELSALLAAVNEHVGAAA